MNHLGLLYLETVQLIEQYRRQGIGTKMLDFIENIAKKKAKDKIQLRAIDGNPALFLYRRHGFKIIEYQGWCVLMSKNVAI